MFPAHVIPKLQVLQSLTDIRIDIILQKKLNTWMNAICDMTVLWYVGFYLQEKYISAA